MNPEEGDLRPQLLDRFGLSLDIKGERDVAKRAEVVKRRVAYDSDPENYIAECQKDLDAECERLTRAKVTRSSQAFCPKKRQKRSSCCKNTEKLLSWVTGSTMRPHWQRPTLALR